MRKPQIVPQIIEIIEEDDFDFALMSKVGPVLSDGRYLHWDDLRRRSPPPGVKLRHWWAAMGLQRRGGAQKVVPMERCFGMPFRFFETSSIRKLLHDFDRNPVQRVLLDFVGDHEALSEYRVRQLIEEAIDSSRIEGARPTTREHARQMLREETAPATKDERMIVNNWLAMQHLIRLKEIGGRLDLEGFLELHAIIGNGALETVRPAGELRQPDDNITVETFDGEVWHEAPPVEPAEGPHLRERIERLLEFAQPEGDTEPFVHPIIRAIIAHFWVGFEHPFCDGNGRMARALFYWVMLQSNYELAEFLSISGPIDRRGNAYYRAFAHVETDHGDLTYFVIDQLEVLAMALCDLVDSLRARQERTAEMAVWVAGLQELNHRQRALLDGAVRHPARSYSIRGHARSHRVHYHTARKDLAELVERGYLTERKVKTAKRFYPSNALRRPAGQGVG